MAGGITSVNNDQLRLNLAVFPERLLRLSTNDSISLRGAHKVALEILHCGQEHLKILNLITGMAPTNVIAAPISTQIGFIATRQRKRRRSNGQQGNDDQGETYMFLHVFHFPFLQMLLHGQTPHHTTLHLRSSNHTSLKIAPTFRIKSVEAVDAPADPVTVHNKPTSKEALQAAGSAQRAPADHTIVFRRLPLQIIPKLTAFSQILLSP